MYVTDYLKDGELERRVRLRKWKAKETSSVHLENGERVGAVLWQVTDGEKFIQLIYNGDRLLQDCEYLKDRQTVSQFSKTFEYDINLLMNSSTPESSTASNFRNVTVQTFNTTNNLPLEIQQITNYKKLRQDCRTLHKEMKAIYNKKKNGTNIEKDEAETELVRKRRAIGDLFRIPHTVWCGKGNKAKKRSDIGALSGADRCCRHHDTGCPFSIQSFSEKYGLFNRRIYTMMHCSCDDRFRSCLKQVNTGASNLVGNLFFNIIQTKCFLLKPEKVCIKQSWWGKCLKYQVKKRAVVRDSRLY
ncbi:group 3 secretory phospholipase A2-like isoform X4 [Artemia franciscana]|uniref:group 3 secretory phospholipase A2-like isoform X4 n=1 Tax=Artemia franciscana TaxID=6661 RepID=UPI0032DB5C01